MPDHYEIVIDNCNSVDHAEVSITKSSLNIKYGPNGLGKSTIAKAIVSQILNDGSLQELTPFKHRGQSGAPSPSVKGVDSLNSALVFDETYVNQFVFQQDEVVRNSFNIFIKTPEYEATMSEIETLLSGIRKSFDDNANIDQILKDLRELRDAFGTPTKGGAIPKSSKIIKAFGAGNNIENVPEKLKPYEAFLKSADPAKWIGWQIKGKEFLSLAEVCPYCSVSFEEQTQKQTVLSVAEEYDVTAVNHLNNLKAVIERLGKYFSDSCRENLEKITGSQVKLSPEGEQFLAQLQASLDLLIKRIEGLRSISFFSLREVDVIDEKIGELRIDLALMDKLNSEDTRSVVDPINAQLDDLAKEVGELKGCINKHKARIEKAIEENQKSINDFLKSAGYKYSVTITPEEDSYKMKLVHEDLNVHIEMASKHLSYGEKNAFALVLFMHQVNREKPDLVVLDDPISSFDKNKKFAILNELFRGKATLRDCTTLMLTHDIEPAIDVVRGVSRVFQGASPSASHLVCKGGVVTEIPITKADIQTFAQICRENIATLTDTLVKCIYLRRHYEIVDDLGLEYNLLASLFKKRDVPTVQVAGANSREMDPQERADAEAKIHEHIADFDYDTLIIDLKDDASMKAKYGATVVGYEKIQLFRLIIGEHENDVITKFVNEAFHIENEYVMQLNPHKFESVPEYVVDECTRIISNT
jgi:ABC-type Mn2+/Zn2+ transport system ATPase subunit